jgi:hypothetical protein
MTTLFRLNAKDGRQRYRTSKTPRTAHKDNSGRVAPSKSILIVASPIGAYVRCFPSGQFACNANCRNELRKDAQFVTGGGGGSTT